MFRRLDISYLFTWIIFTSYHVNTIIPDPCPVIEPATKVSDMCKASDAVEHPDAGNENIDSVVLRVMIQEDRCVCHVTVDNSLITAVFIKKYGNTVAPEYYPCGLAIDISNDKIADSPNPIECKSGHDLRSVAFSSTGVITLTSRVIGGNFTTGYCIQVSKPDNHGINSVLKLICNTPPSTIGATISKVESNSTQQITVTSTQQMTTQTYLLTEDDNSGVHIGIGVGAGIFIIITFVMIIVILYKRKSPQTVIQNEGKSKSNVNENSAENSEYDGLKCNVLYVSSENEEKCDVNYSPADRDKPHDSGKRNHTSHTQYTISHNGYAVVDKAKQNVNTKDL